MSLYSKLNGIASKYVGTAKSLKFGLNNSPVYRRSTAKITSASKDLMDIKIKLPISYKNRNYVNTIFGGIMFSAVDPIPMIQLMHLIGNKYVVWDKSAEIFFKRPATENLYADFIYATDELAEIKQRVDAEKEIEIVKVTQLTNKDKSIVFCEVRKTIYVADKAYYNEKKAKRKQQKKDA